MQYTFGNISENIVVKTSDISILWTPNITLANQIPSSTTGTCTITCTTYTGTTNIGTSTCTLKLTFPSDIKPTISKFTISKIDNIVPNYWNIYIKSKSMVKLNIESYTGSYGSSITSYSISGGGYSSNSSTLTTGFLNTSGNITFTAIDGWLGWFLGGCDGLSYTLLAFIVTDYITGVMCAIADKKLSSAIGFKGIFKKILILIFVGIGHILDTQIIGNGSVLRTAIIFFYLSNEGISLTENASYLGLSIPEKLKDILKQLHNRFDKEDK